MSTLPSAICDVYIQDICMVKPLLATNRFHLYLPPVDTVHLGLLHIRDVLFYPLPATNNAGPSSCDMLTLKHGLATALVDFYPVAGRLCLAGDGKLTIDCNDAGVKFVEAMAPEHNFCELQEAHFPIHDFYDNLAGVTPDMAESLQETALLSIQVTMFKDGGGIAIGVAASHVVFDGHSLWYFLNAWGECCRKQGVSLPPLHVRSVLNPQHLLPNSESPMEECPTVPLLALPKYVAIKGYHKVLHFDAPTVQQLKQTAIAESGNTKVSSLQAVLACVWKRVVTAHDFPPQLKVCMNLKADVRQRLRPALTQAYFGNALETLYVNATAADLMKECIGEIAGRINEALRVLDDEAYLRERLAKSKEGEMRQLLEELLQGKLQVMFVTHGSKFPVYEVDVGMGRPVAVRPPTINSDSSIVVYPSQDAGAVDVCVRFASLHTFNAFLSIASPSFDI